MARQKGGKTELIALMDYAREIWRKDKKKARSIATEDRDFREFFGCGALVALEVWNRLLDKGILPDGG